MKTSKRAAFGVAMAIGLIACGDDTVVTDSGTDGSVQPDSGNPDVTVNDTGSDSTVSDAPTDVASDVVTGDGGGATSIACGNASCTLPSQACCYNPNNNKFACSGDGGTCPTGDVALQCASAVDCTGGQVCCLNASVDPAVAKCAATCTGQDHALLCNPTGTPQANACGDAGACGNGNIDTWGLTNKFGTCGDQTGPF
jgi:hypothetical protein